MSNSPLLWGPNLISNNLENSILNINGNTLTWEGLKNYVYGGGFENNSVNGWTSMGLATITNGLPITVGSGGAIISSSNGGRAKGANTTAPAIISSGQLSGLYSLNLATSGAGTIGDGYISPAYTIDISDQGKVLNLNFKYKVVTGSPNMSGTSSNTYAAAVYDVVNNAWLGLAGSFNFVQTTGVGQFVGTVQTAINTTSLQIFIYSPVAPVAASALYLDDIFLGPQQVQKGPAMSDWVAYTPTFTGFGSPPTSIAVYSRRVGDSLEVQGSFTSGTTTAVQAQMTLGYNGANANVVIDTTKVASGSIIGAAGEAAASTTYFTESVLASGANNYVTFGQQTSTTNMLTAANGNALVNSTTAFTFYFKVPIVGWSSNSVMSADTDTRVVAMRCAATTPTGTLAAAFNTVIYGTAPYSDTHGAYNTTTGAYIIPVSGYYDIAASYGVNATWAVNNRCLIKVYVASAAIGNSNTVKTQVAGATSQVVQTSIDAVYCTAGQAVTISSYVEGTTPSFLADVDSNWFSVSRRSGPAVVAASESVNGRYYSSSSTITSSLGLVTYSTKSRDSHNAYASGTLTIPVSGMYQFNAKLVTSDTSGAHATYIAIYQNGVEVSANNLPGTAASTAADVEVNDIFPCLSGDLITIKASDNGTTPVIAGNTTRNYFSWARVGN